MRKRKKRKFSLKLNQDRFSFASLISFILLKNLPETIQLLLRLCFVFSSLKNPPTNKIRLIRFLSSFFIFCFLFLHNLSRFFFFFSYKEREQLKLLSLKDQDILFFRQFSLQGLKIFKTMRGKRFSKVQNCYFYASYEFIVDRPIYCIRNP